MWFLFFFWVRLKIKTDSGAPLLCERKNGKYCTAKGVSIPDRNLVCGVKASLCGR